MTIPTDPPDFEAIRTWLGGTITVASIVGVAVWRGLKDAARVARDDPEERPTRIITADTVAMDRLAQTIDAARAVILDANALLKQLIQLGQEYGRRLEEDRQEAEINQRIKDQLATELGRRKPRRRTTRPRPTKTPT